MVVQASAQQTDQQVMMFLKAAFDLEKGLVSAEALLNDDVVKQVVSCLNIESSSTSVLEQATELVAALFSHDAAKKAVANKPRPIVDALFTCLRNNANVPVVQQHIFAAIGNLTDYPDASQNWLVSDHDAINIVVRVLKQSPSLADLQAQAYYALQKIAMGNKANIGFLFNTHLAHQLALTSMTNHATHVSLQTQACALLRRLSFFDETHSVLMTTATATVIQSMRSFAAEPQVQEQGCVFINNMADVDNQKLLVREPYLAHQLILSAMHNHPQIAVVQEDGCAALWNLSHDADNKKLLVREPHLAHQLILSAMHNHPQIAAVQQNGCGALWSLAGDADNKKLLVREPHLAHQVILSAMRSHPQIAAVQQHGCGALRDLAVDADNKKLLVREPHLAHQVILSAMRNHPQIAAVQEQGCGALRSLAVDTDNKKLLVREPHLAHQLILSAMHNHPQIAAVQEQGCGALWSLAFDAENRKLLVREPDLAHQVILSAMRNHPQNAAVQEQGCGALRNLAADDDNQKLLVQSDAHFTVIAALKTHPQQEGVQLRAVWALTNLSYEVSNLAALQQADALPLCEKAQNNFPTNNDLAAQLATLKQNLA